MLKNLASLEIKIGEKLYHFHCDLDSPIENVKEALCQFLSYAVQVANAAAAQVKEKEEQKQEKTNE